MIYSINEKRAQMELLIGEIYSIKNCGR